MRAGPRSFATFETQRPPFVQGEILQAYYDGETDDLLTAGLGRSGLAALTLQNLVRFADPARPTPVELRRSAIWNSHLGLIDRTDGGGYSRLFGPGVVRPGVVVGDGKVSGHEYMASIDSRMQTSLMPIASTVPRRVSRFANRARNKIHLQMSLGSGTEPLRSARPAPYAPEQEAALVVLALPSNATRRSVSTRSGTFVRQNN